MGLIHLYSATSTSFDDNGTPLVTAREAVVKRNEGFQLTFSIPISQNDLHKRVQKEMIVSAMTPDGVNYFRIWDIEKRTTDVKVTALQLLYSLDVKKINPFGGKQYTGDSVLRAFVNSFKSSISPYTFSSSIVTSRDFYTNEKDDTSTSHNALAILNKITDTWSGELMLNGFDVRMISKLGTKTDALLYEHKNIASFSDSSSMNGIVTRIYATATYTPERAEGAKEDPEPVVLTATVDSPLINQYAVIYEATMEYNDARTVAELRTEILKQYSEFNVDKPERTIDVDTNIVDGTAINFGDELVLKYLVHDVDEVIRCVGYEYDPISENYIVVTLGTLEKTFLTNVTEGISSSVSSQIDKINNQIQGIQTAANGKNRIAYGPSPVPNPIEGDLWFYHPEGRPDEVELLVYQNGLWLPAPFLTDQDKTQFEQEMADHYDAALAEIERKDQEYKEIFDAYDEQVATIDKGISDAATKAQNALEAAGISTDLAQTAKDLATTAKTNASTAITNANQAKADASTAITNANQAKADAQTAITDASTALKNANVAKTDAQTAVADASQAVIDANTAKSNAQTAITNASTAITNAAQAKTDASKAVTDASQAVADAQTAITQSGQAISSANTAKTNAQTAIDDAKSALTTAGNAKTTADTLSVKVDDLEGEVELKASQTEVDGISGTVSTHTTTLSQQATAIASKADKTVVDTLSGTVSNQGTLISQNATDIASKASASSVNTLTGRVDTAESNISQNATAITQRVTTTTYNAGMSSKENAVIKQSTAPTHANGKLWLDTSTTPNVLKRSNGSAWIKATPTTASEVGAYSQSDGAGLAGRLTTAETNITQTSTAITSKADKSVVDTLSGTVSTHTTTLSQQATAISSKADKSVVDTLSGTVDNHTTEIAQNATDIATKASASSVNTLTGRVDTAESNISQNATAITQRVTTTTYNAGIASKENTVLKQSAAPSHANGRLWLDTSVTPNVLKRSTGKAWVKATPTTPGEVGAYSQSDGAGLAGRLTTAETNITQTATAITSKADKSVVDTLAGTVDTHTTEIAQNATAIASKASASSVNTLTGRVSTAETKIIQNATAITSKASQSEVDTVKGTVASHTSTLSQHASQISARLTSAQVNSLVDGKGFSTVNYVDSQITASADGIRANMTKVEGKIDGLQVGGRNLAINSTNDGQGWSSTAYNVISRLELSEDWVVGETYTVSIKGTVNEPNRFGVWRDMGSVGLGTLMSYNPLTGVYTRTYSNIRDTPRAEKNVISVYNVPSSSATEARIEWIKVEKGNKATDWSPAPEDTMMEDDFNIFKASYEATAENLSSRLTAVDKVGGRLSTAETKISQNAKAISSKASQQEVDTVKGTVSGHTTTLSQHATQIASKAESSLVNTIKGTVDTHTTKISQNATAIASKASTSSVNTLTGRVSTAESNISQNATAISARLTSSQVNSLVDGKGFAKTTYVDSQIKATADSFGAKLTKVEGKIPISVQEENLVIKGDEYHYSNAYLVARYDLTKDLVIGKTYTIVLKGGIGSDGISQKFALFTDNSGNLVGTLQHYPGGIYKLTFVLLQNGVDSGDKKHIHIYNLPNNTSPARIDWIKLVEGDVTDNNFTPSRADLFTQNGFDVFETDFNVKAGGWDATSSYVSNNKTKINSLISNADGWQNTISYVNNNKTKINQTISRVDSYQQTIGANGEKIAQLVMTDSVYQTSIRKGGRNLLKNSYGRVANPNRLHSSYDVKDPIPNGTRVTLSFRASSGTNQVVQIYNSNHYYFYGDVVMTGGTTERVYHISFTWNTNSNGGSTIDINNQKLHIYNKLQPNPTAYITTQWVVLQYGEIGTEHYISDDEDFETQVTQLADSWALRLKSGNDIKTQINASTDAIRLSSKFIHLNGSSLIDNATIKSAHIDSLNANKITGNTADFNAIRTGVLTANAVTSTHINANNALFDKLFSTTSATDRLSARDAWIQNANIIGINANKITAGTISASRISTSSLDNIELGGRNYAQGTTDKMQYQQVIGRYSGSIAPSNASKVIYTVAELGVKAGDTLTASIYIGAGGGYGSGLRVDNQSGYPKHHSPVVAHSYTSVTFTVDSTDTEFRFFYARASGSGTAEYRIEACRFKLEKGNKRTDWSRNPEDFGISGRVEIHGGNIKADTLDVGAITGDKATFISKGFKSLNSQSTINGHAIRIQNSAGEFVEMNNTPELRSDDAGGTAVVLGKGRVHFYDSRGYSKGYVGCDIHTAGSYDFGTFLSKGSGIYRFARMADATQTTYAYYTVKAGKTSPSPIITDMVQNGYLPDGNAQQFVAKGNMISQLNGWPNYPNWPTLKAGQKIRYKELTTQTTGDAYETIWKFGPSSQGDWRIYFSKHATFEGGTTGTSDRRLKHDIETTQIEALGHIESLAFKEFRWNRDNKYEPLGLIAQDSGLLRVSDDDMEGIDIQRSIMLGLKGVQELQAIVKAQAEKIKQLEGIINQ